MSCDVYFGVLSLRYHSFLNPSYKTNQIVRYRYVNYRYKQCCGYGSGIRCFFNPRVLDPPSRIPTHIPESLVHNFWGKKRFNNSMSDGTNFVVCLFKNKIIFYKFCEIYAYKKVRKLVLTSFFNGCLYCDTGWKKQDPG